jgi:[calcium/calmodulin-dependent protein kinase] kinase
MEQKEKNTLLLIKEELAIIKKLNHLNLVALIEVLDNLDEDSLYMVLEMCKNGVVMCVRLDEKADPYDVESCRCWFRDLILGVEYRELLTTQSPLLFVRFQVRLLTR